MQFLIPSNFTASIIRYFNFILICVLVGCSSAQIKTKIELKSDPSLCYSMIYKQQSVSDKYFNLLLEEALKRDLDCRLIEKEILDFKNYIMSSSMSNSITADSTESPPTEIVHPVTGQTPR